MGDSYKTCELHGKPFPNNMVDTRKVDVSRLYVERKEEIEGEKVTFSLFLGAKNENEGADVCAMCMQEKLINLLSANGDTCVWKIIEWHPVTMTKKDGSGTYTRNEKTTYTIDEYIQKLKEDKKKLVAPTTK